MTAFKLFAEVKGAHVHTRVFAGADLDHLALSGELVFDEEEFFHFQRALFAGGARVKPASLVEVEAPPRLMSPKCPCCDGPPDAYLTDHPDECTCPEWCPNA